MGFFEQTYRPHNMLKQTFTNYLFDLRRSNLKMFLIILFIVLYEQFSYTLCLTLIWMVDLQ